MQIDWFTLIAQIVNFVILLALLKHFLFDRIVATMDKRRDKIAAELSSAEQKEKQAEEQLQKYRRQEEELQARQDAILEDAREEAKRKRQELIDQARKEVESQKANWKESLERQQKDLENELRRQLGAQVYAVSRKVLADLANRDIEKRIVEKFIRQLEELDDEMRKRIGSLLENLKGSLLVITSFEPSPADKKRITEAIRSQLVDGVETRYETSSELIGGIVIEADGRRVAWTIDGFLSELENRLAEMVERSVGDDRKNTKD